MYRVSKGWPMVWMRWPGLELHVLEQQFFGVMAEVAGIRSRSHTSFRLDHRRALALPAGFQWGRRERLAGDTGSERGRVTCMDPMTVSPMSVHSKRAGPGC